VFIVDTQVHIWKEETPDRPWIPGARERMRLNGHREAAFTYQECIDLMDEAGVDRVLIVPPSWEGDRIDYALEACEAHPGRFGITARVPRNKPEGPSTVPSRLPPGAPRAAAGATRVTRPGGPGGWRGSCWRGPPSP
jgi:predicted TIM-barrel fold metal-dependent hydrolase